MQKKFLSSVEQIAQDLRSTSFGDLPRFPDVSGRELEQSVGLNVLEMSPTEDLPDISLLPNNHDYAFLQNQTKKPHLHERDKSLAVLFEDQSLRIVQTWEGMPKIYHGQGRFVAKVIFEYSSPQILELCSLEGSDYVLRREEQVLLSSFHIEDLLCRYYGQELFTLKISCLKEKMEFCASFGHLVIYPNKRAIDESILECNKSSVL